jgi:hypothetical protein
MYAALDSKWVLFHAIDALSLIRHTGLFPSRPISSEIIFRLKGFQHEAHELSALPVNHSCLSSDIEGFQG